MLTTTNSEHHMAGFTKLFASITDSTIWQAPNATRIVWITMLAMADQNGYVGASVPGLASRARVTMDDCLAALTTLLSPDEWSRTKDFEGRRIAEADGGWVLLNHAKYRAKLNAVDRREQSRVGMAKIRAERKQELTVSKVNSGEHRLTQAEAEAEKDIPPPDGGFSVFWDKYPKKVARKAAEKAFKAAKLNNLSPVLADIDSRMGGEDWKKERGKYVPHPATYLNHRRWEDGETVIAEPPPLHDDTALRHLQEQRALSKPPPPEIRARLQELTLNRLT